MNFKDELVTSIAQRLSSESHSLIFWTWVEKRILKPY